jgi:hypothetical protein
MKAFVLMSSVVVELLTTDGLMRNEKEVLKIFGIFNV